VADRLTAKERQDMLLMDLELAWERVAEVPGPGLGDPRPREVDIASWLRLRGQAFSARIEAFRKGMGL
jgi:hypothetical protein